MAWDASIDRGSGEIVLYEAGRTTRVTASVAVERGKGRVCGERVELNAENWEQLAHDIESRASPREYRMCGDEEC